MADLQFKYVSDQSHQIRAIEAVTKLFQGQEYLSRQFMAGSINSLSAKSEDAQNNDWVTSDLNVDATLFPAGTADEPVNLFEAAHYQGQASGIGYSNGMRISPKQLLENLHSVQEENALPQTDVMTEGRLRDFTVEMETGTGKTYVYIRTIFELNRQFKLTKFIIVVPSVAIREGVMKTFSSTRKHFSELYDNPPYDVFLYDSKNMGPVANFATSSGIQIMIISIDAFNRAYSKKGEKNNGNVFHRPSELLPDGRSPRELVAECNPIVIIDEPQSVDSTPKAKAAIKSLNPLFVLRYSATHRDPYNMVYRLTPVDAFEEHLVKGICVDSILSDEDFNGSYVRFESVQRNPIRAKLAIDYRENDGSQKRKVITCKTGDDLYVKSNENSDYEGVHKGWLIQNIDSTEGQEFVSFANGVILELGEAVGDVSGEAVKRAQIRCTVRDHLQKQLAVFEKGIKVLSLFFIDQVERYRDEDGQPGPYVRMFEEEYRSVAKEFAPIYERRGVPLPLEPEGIHEGYFSRDGKGRLSNNTSTIESDVSTFEAIMKSKERLVTFPDGRDPVSNISFIWSHSALKEGWDNPNVFQICTLVDTANTMTKRQKIGRGLRLCVNQNGERCHDSSVNVLTVVANESYREFAEGLQKDFEHEGYRFGVVTPEAFAKVEVVNEKGESELLGYKKSQQVYDFLVSEELVLLDGTVTEQLKHQAELGLVKVPAELESAREGISAVIAHNAAKLPIKNKRDEVSVHLVEAVNLSSEFQELWKRISRRCRYEISLDTNEIVDAAVEEILSMPKVRPVEVRSYKAELSVDDSGVEALETGNSVVNTAVVRAYNLPDAIGELQDAVGLTRPTIHRILKNSGRYEEFYIDPATYLSQVAVCINRAKTKLLSKGISYIPLPEELSLSEEILKVDELKAYLGENAYKPVNNKSLYNYVVYDSSTVELPFAHELDMREEIKVFVKLPPHYVIDTPFGTYNPDWAYVQEESDGTLSYHVVETKGGTNANLQVRPREEAKIECAKKYFEALGISDLTYEPLNKLN